MNMTSFLQDKRLTIALKGDIDHHSAKETMRIIGNKIDLYLPMVCVLDFRDVTFMDSSGIAIVIACVRHMRQLRGKGRYGRSREALVSRLTRERQLHLIFTLHAPCSFLQ